MKRLFEPKWKKAVRRLKKNDPTLTKLNLGFEEIGDEEAKVLAEALLSNSTLTELALNSNQIGDEGAKALAEALLSNSSLTLLYLSDNQIGDEGAKALAEALLSNSTLTKLNLGFNYISNEGAKVLAETLMSNSSLTELKLYNNQIGDEGAKAIWTALKDYNTTLAWIDIRYNSDISESLKQKIDDIVKANKNGTRTDLARVRANQQKLQNDKAAAQQRQQQQHEHPNDTTVEANNNRKQKAEIPRRKKQNLTAVQQQQQQQQHPIDLLGANTRKQNADQQALRRSLQRTNPRPIQVNALYVQSIWTLETEILGEGFFGTVRRGYDKVLALEFAVKTNRVPVHQLDQEHLRHVKKSFQTELETLHAFRHPNIVVLYAYHTTPALDGEQFLLYELAEKGALSAFFANDFGRDRLASFQLRVEIALGVMTAIQFLHEGNDKIKQCLHRDIKSDNIVLMADMTAKLIDCGLAKLVPRVGKASATYGGKGTDEYMCPLYQRNELEQYEAKCDIFSFGVVLAELWTGHLQNHYKGRHKVNFYSKYGLGRGNIVADMDNALDIKDCSKTPSYATKFALLSKQCMSTELDDRPSGTEVLSQLQSILVEREKDTKENADVKAKQETAYPITSSVKMQCRDCRLRNVRCHATPSGYICLPCLLCYNRKKTIEELLPEIRANRDLLGKTLASLDSFAGVLASLDARMVNPIPVLFVVLPCKRSQFQKHPRSWFKSRTHNKYRLFFVCSHSSRAVKAPVKFRVSREWVIRIAPFLVYSLYALQMAGRVVTGLNLELGAFARSLADQIDPEKLTEILDSVIEILRENSTQTNADILEDLRSRRLNSSNIGRLDKDSINPIVELASAQRGWSHEMKHVQNPSDPARSMWVLNEYASQFRSVV